MEENTKQYEEFLGLIPKRKSDIDSRNISYSTVFKLNRTARRHILDARIVRDQKNRGTCVSFGVAGVMDTANKQINSPLYNYNKAKSICPFGLNEEGTYLSIGIQAAYKFGTVEEQDYPYENYLALPKLVFPPIPEATKAKAELPQNRFDAYVQIKTLEELKDHILHGTSVAGGFTVGLGTFFKPELLPNGDAVIQMPAGSVAGHVMDIIGFDDDMEYTFQNPPSYHENLTYMPQKPVTFKGFVKVVQSYGTGASRREFGTDDVVVWTESGYGWIPYEYVFGTYDPVGTGIENPWVNELFALIKNFPMEFYKFDAKPPFIKNGRTLLPIRFVAETLGFNVNYDNGNIKISNNERTVNMRVGSKKMYVNAECHEMLAAPEIVQGRTYIPVRDVVVALGAKIQWFKNEQKVEIQSEDKIIELWVGNPIGRILKRK